MASSSWKGTIRLCQNAATKIWSHKDLRTSTSSGPTARSDCQVRLPGPTARSSDVLSGSGDSTFSRPGHIQALGFCPDSVRPPRCQKSFCASRKSPRGSVAPAPCLVATLWTSVDRKKKSIQNSDNGSESQVIKHPQKGAYETVNVQWLLSFQSLQTLKSSSCCRRHGCARIMTGKPSSDSRKA